MINRKCYWRKNNPTIRQRPLLRRPAHSKSISCWRRTVIRKIWGKRMTSALSPHFFLLHLLIFFFILIVRKDSRSSGAFACCSGGESRSELWSMRMRTTLFLPVIIFRATVPPATITLGLYLGCLFRMRGYKIYVNIYYCCFLKCLLSVFKM